MANHEAYLRSALSVYRHPELAARDITNCIGVYVDLRPQRDTFVFNDGSRKEYLCLSGTIPVTYKRNTYNIPLCLWLLDTHPHNPPMVYVKPTSNMQIKPSKHVDNTGRVYLPYLHDWKHPGSDLLGLVQILVIVFSEEPPVFSKGSGPQRPPPPVPYTASSVGVTNNPPYPTSAQGMPVPSYPAVPATGYQVPTAYPPTTGYPQYPAYPGQTLPGQAPLSAAPGGYSAPAFPAYPPQQTSYHQTGAAPTTQPGTGTLSLSDEQIRMSLLTAVEDKMRRRLKEIFAQAQAEISSLQKIQEDLQNGKSTLDNMMQMLEKEQNDLELNTKLLDEKNQEMTAALSKMENNDKLDIDEAVTPTAPLYKQLLNAFAEEQATEDTIYYLGEALRKGFLELDVFLKQVRELSRKQFMLRALINKCREKAGLKDIRG
ncbi:hypothetical protein LSH36_335g03016 [Paralvinella palmiformis]|uniref:Tumor susceptibility gene 101 protein n=1 Tax=Paralvinella palmiformis TaxID=53620 RepID=A0AAD9N2Y3_9ANNE|nr:hypothetical protein LSH36_335g03016 [Paralvinella palmiformis]